MYCQDQNALWNIIIPKHLLLSRFISSSGKFSKEGPFLFLWQASVEPEQRVMFAGGLLLRIWSAHVIAHFCHTSAWLSTTYFRLTQRWHYSGSRRPVTGMRWSVPACLRIFIYTSPPKRRIFLKLEGIASQTLVVIGYWRASIELGRGYSASNTIVYRHLQIESHWQSRRSLTVGYDN